MRTVQRHSGFTLVELLVVVAIIAIITGISVPILAKGGLFSGNKTNASAADLFAQLRAAHVHATTNNVDTALAYGVIAPYDSLYSGTFGVDVQINADIVPAAYIALYPPINDALLYDPENAVLDSTLMVRRIKIDELKELDEDGTGMSLAQAITQFDLGDEFATYNDIVDDDVFVSVSGSSSVFDPLPNDSCVLTNHPLVDDTPTSFQERTGLRGIVIFRIQLEDTDADGDDDWVVDRILTRGNDGFPITGADLNVMWTDRFPAHIFSKKDGMDVNSNLQRLTLSVGLRPDVDYYERYLVDEDTGQIELDANNELISLDTDIELYVATGRVKVSDDRQ